MNFEEEYSLRKEDILTWAYRTDNSGVPHEDWDLLILLNKEAERTELLIQLATDKNCPQQHFFIGVLYTKIRDYFRCNDISGFDLFLKNYLIKNTDLQDLSVYAKIYFQQFFTREKVRKNQWLVINNDKFFGW